MATILPSQRDNKAVLNKAVPRAAKAMGITQEELGRILGRDRSSITRGIDPNSKAGELGLLLIRCYRALYTLVGGNEADIKHWFTTHNSHTGGIPKEQVRKIQGLVQVVGYLEAMRGKS